MQFVFTANPEDYTNRGSIVTPLKDRIGSQILTHYPESIAVARTITHQEAKLDKQQSESVYVPSLAKDLLEQIAFEARESEYIDNKSGVSARMTITAYENLLSAAERRALKSGADATTVRLSDFMGIIPAITGKVELVYEGEQEGAAVVAQHLIGDAIHTFFPAYFPKIEKLEKDIDWFWWWNFCFKWQSTWFIKLTLCAPKLRVNLTESYINDYTPHFFDSTQFQLWSINNPQVRILNKWTDHKYQAKLEIYNFDKNKNYLENKVKRGSLKTIFNQRLLFEGIDSDFNVINKINPDQWYTPNNIFK
jgi:hypothetical protein